MSLSLLAIELGWFFHPLDRAVQSGETLSEYLGQFGYDLPQAGAANALADLANLQGAFDALRALIDQVVDAAADPDDISEAQISQIGLAGNDVYAAVDGIVDVVQTFAGQNPGPELALELLDRLIDDYLGTRLPVAREVFAALDVRRSRPVPAGSPGARSLDFTEVRYDFARLGQFLNDTGQWADEVYGWGRDFDYPKAISVLANLVESFGGRVRLEPTEQAVAALFLANIPRRALPIPGAVPEPVLIIRAKLPVFAKTETTAAGDLGARMEAGLTVLPVGDFAQPAQMGLAFAPYVEGALGAEQALSDRLTFRFAAQAAATGGVAVTIQPSGIGTRGGAAATASFEASLTYANADASPVILIGRAGGTRVEAGRFLASAGGSMDGDFFVAGGVGGLSAVIDMGSDGLLGAIIPDPVSITAGDIMLGYRPGRGVYFEGGTSLAIDIPLNLDLTLLKIMGLGLKLDWSDRFAIDVTLEGEVKIGPLYGYADGIGLRTRIVERQGLFGRHDLDFSFIPPTAYAVSLDISPIEGGGLISLNDPEYRGALALKFQTIGFSAFGILNTRLPGGRPGFSFAASIFGEFNLPLGYGFFLTGLGGIIGINRTIDTNAMRAVLYEGRFDNLLFPADPIANAATILDDMAAILPAREGQHVFGPVARIGWGVPTLIALKLGVIIEVGQDVRLLILGGLESDLPTREAAVVSLRLSFFGEIDFAARTISFDATLQNSRILTFALSGDVALRTGWAPRIEHIVSFGGLHPQFPRPANLPDLRRITIAFGADNPRITLTAYAAVTLNSLQFGADLRVYAEGPDIWLIGQLAAEGWAYFNALIIFDPFAFSANLGGGISLLRNGKVVCGLGFDITLTGPNTFRIDGRVWVTVFGIDVDFPIRHTFGSRASLPGAQVDAVVMLRDALTKAKVEPIDPPRDGAAVRLRVLAAAEAKPLDPQGGALVQQNAVPLAITIDRLGEAIVTGPRRLDIALSLAGQPVAGSRPVQADFVHGHFFATTEAEKLRATAYDRLKSGATLASAGLDTPVAAAVSAVYEHEEIIIPVADDRASGFSSGGEILRLQAELLARGVRVSSMERLTETVRLTVPLVPRDSVLAGEPGYTTRAMLDAAIRNGNIASGAGVPQGGRHGSFAEARDELGLVAGALTAIAGDRRAAPDSPTGRGGVFADYIATAAGREMRP